MVHSLDLLLLQGRLKEIQEHAGCAAATATEAAGAVKQVALEALQTLQQTETGFNKSSKEVAVLSPDRCVF